jgi:hypothetical protein
MSTWGDVASAVSKFAPILGNAVPGVGTVVGAGVGLAASVIAKALGTDPSPDSIMSALSADPDAIVKLRQAEMDHEKDLVELAKERELGVLAAQTAQYSAEALDRDSARKMAMAGPPDWWVRPAIVLALTLGAFGIVTAIFLPWTRDVIRDPIATGMLGIVTGYWFKELAQALAFYFGATKEATDQTREITSFAVSPGAVVSPSSTTTTTIQSPSNQPQAVTVAPADNLYRGS